MGIRVTTPITIRYDNLDGATWRFLGTVLHDYPVPTSADYPKDYQCGYRPNKAVTRHRPVETQVNGT